MKLFKSALLLVILSLVFLSCKKDSKSDVPTTPVTPFISFKVDGGALEQTEVAPLGQWFTNGINTLQINGQVSPTEGVGLSINNPKVGTFDVVKDNLGITYSTKISTGGTTYVADSGTVTITAFSGTSVTGTFQFTASNILNSPKTKVITEGKFTSDVTKH